MDSADLFGTTTIEAETEEEAERKFEALREGKSLTNLPDTQTEDSLGGEWRNGCQRRHDGGVTPMPTGAIGG